jgi:hypothetical protein
MFRPALVACISIGGVALIGRRFVATVNLPRAICPTSKDATPRDAQFALTLRASHVREIVQLAYSFGTNMAKEHRDWELKFGN